MSTRSTLPFWVEIAKAQKTNVAFCPGLLTQDDFEDLESAVQHILKVEDPVENNNQNADHENKMCIILSKTSDMPGMIHIPRVLAKILRFAKAAAAREGWTAPGGALEGVGDVGRFKVRTAERWRYGVGGGLTNQTHLDHGSLLTLVSALDDGYEGGIFRTGTDEDGTTKEHRMKPGDCVCFLSHKYHNVTPVTSGTRHSLVIELWEGRRTC